ncbi:hypothetical protein Sjap_018712 [Stephania japonica]|uniref:Plant heme peroxidase family profile domain-containing protein n=1 Tax=Stephania japonica TaxID=461633 RepID=A0AAP0I8M2_9MAGN
MHKTSSPLRSHHWDRSVPILQQQTLQLQHYDHNGADPTIDPTFVPQLRALCPQNGDGSRRVALDTGSQNTFDDSYFKNLKNGRGVLESDQKLWTDPATRTIVQRYSGTIRGLFGLRFSVEFARSMVKMSNVGVKTGSQGQIRRVCTAIN